MIEQNNHNLIWMQLTLREKDRLGISKVNRQFFDGVVSNGRMSTMSTTLYLCYLSQSSKRSPRVNIEGHDMRVLVAAMVYPFVTRLKSCNKSTRVPSAPARSVPRHSSGDVRMIPYFTVSDRTVYGFHVHNLRSGSSRSLGLQLAISINLFLLAGFQLSSLLLRR